MAARKSTRSRGDITVSFSDEAREAWTCFIVAAKLTKNSADDPSTISDLLEQVDSPIRRFTADGAYDTRSVYERLGEVGIADIEIVIPPRRGAVPLDGAAGTWAQRNATLETIQKVGRQGWQRGIDDRAPSRIFSSGTSARWAKPSCVRLRMRRDDRVQRIEPNG